ncbi:MAG TPA: branched-chain amino acid aminotransferase [Bacillota bacterium]|jgi:branched-chain amino acid aminotransferase|nr:branched-chain amino acid aminotransferase [Bacillota bacterium]HOL09504.1 branched-chain amino acid aminotransferase [Bacillota bacterium]HPO97534.1 branched-chain amino acid aminotransferase [Bacillota bacterium]
MNITIERVAEEELKPLYSDPNQLGFGKVFTDHMFTITYHKGKGWVEPKISKYEPFQIDPAAVVLHYSQEIFEGLKAYVTDDGRILLFRPEANAKRMYDSAIRMCMEPLPVEMFVEAIETLVNLDKKWIPRAPGTSLYIRPTLIGLGSALGVHPADEYMFYVILSPVAAYFKEGFKPISLYVEDTYIRAAIGGVGNAKTGGNYAASLLAAAKAQEKGFSQVLWLDAKERKYVEEVGAMNIFFVIGKKLVTPNLGGSILPGITRASVIELARSLGYEVEERLISIDEIIDGVNQGTVTEAFGTGTAAVISPVGSLYYKEHDYKINNYQVGPITQELYTKLTDIQYGREKDQFGWVKEIGRL